MANKLIDLYNHLLKYNEKTIYVAFHTKPQEPKFNEIHVEIVIYKKQTNNIIFHLGVNLKKMIYNYFILYSRKRRLRKIIYNCV